MLTITFYMKSGNQVVIRAKEFSMTRLTGSQAKELTIKDPTCTAWSIDLDQVEAVVAYKE